MKLWDVGLCSLPCRNEKEKEMGNIRITADSTCDLSKELVEQYGISVLPLNIVMDDKSYLDGVETSPEKIYEWADAAHTTQHRDRRRQLSFYVRLSKQARRFYFSESVSR